MSQVEQAGAERVLVVTAHPDDVDFGAAGTVAGWTAAGVDVTYCVVTDGDAGGFDADVSRDEMRRLRQAEQRAAAEAVGVTDVRFLGYPDGRLYVTHELRRDIVRVIRQVRPQRVLTQSPERDWTRIGASHPDHLAAGEAAVAAVYPDARNEFAHPELLADEGLAPHTVPDLWLMAAPAGRGQVRYVDVTDGFDRKLAALRAHASQIVNIPDLEGLLRQWMGANARAGGLADGRLAESFQVVDAS